MVQIKRRVGRYDIVEVIGRGGAAVVYLAYQPDLHRQVALKELSPYYAADRSFAERFVQESRLIAAMNHPSIVTVHEYFEDDEVPYIAMEYLPRGSLRPYIGRLGIAEVVGVLESILAGLAHGESQGIVHRDLKPENLLVADEGRVKIADFGVARAINNATPGAVVTATGTVIGTPAYMAPEQALGGELTPATDLYSLGLVVWELLSGRTPLEHGDNPAAVLYRQVHEEVPPIGTVVPDVDPRLADWLARMVRKAPDERFAGAQRAWEGLEDIAIELLGPRWRREARLGLQAAGIAETAPTPEADVRSPPPWSPIPETVAPRPRSATTSVRPARRHRPEGDGDAPGAGRRALRGPLIAGLLAVAIVVVAVLAVLLPGSGNGHRAGRVATGSRSTRAATASTTTSTPAVTATTASLAASVRDLNGIVRLFVDGKRLSHNRHQYPAAAANRQLVLKRLATFRAPAQLSAAAGTLRQMASDSLQFNLDMARGETALAQAPDTAHNVLRPRFVTEFNPYARRYLAVSYTVNDL